MSQKLELLAKEGVASIRDIQKNPSKVLKGITRVVRGSRTIGFFFSNEELDDLLEDMEASTSTGFKAWIRQARKQVKEGKTVPLSVVAKKYGV